MLTLVGRSWRRIAPVCLGLAAVLCFFQLVLIVVSASYEQAGSFERLATLLPAFAQRSFGAAMTSFAGLTTVGFYETGIILMVSQFAIFVGSEPAGDVEAGFVDMVLARPMPRHWIVTRSLVVMMTGTLTLTLMMGAGTWIGLVTLAPAHVRWPEPRLVVSLIAHLTLVAWSFGAAALAASGWTRRRAAAWAPVALAAVAMYLIDFLGLWWTAMWPINRVTPFHFYQGSAVIEGRANTALDLSVLAAATVVASAIAYWQFNRRDV